MYLSRILRNPDCREGLFASARRHIRSYEVRSYEVNAGECAPPNVVVADAESSGTSPRKKLNRPCPAATESLYSVRAPHVAEYGASGGYWIQPIRTRATHTTCRQQEHLVARSPRRQHGQVRTLTAIAQMSRVTAHAQMSTFQSHNSQNSHISLPRAGFLMFTIDSGGQTDRCRPVTIRSCSINDEPAIVGPSRSRSTWSNPTCSTLTSKITPDRA